VKNISEKVNGSKTLPHDPVEELGLIMNSSGKHTLINKNVRKSLSFKI
jgi:hypothetical protein